MKCTINFEMNNAAFDGNEAGETARILNELAERIKPFLATPDELTIWDLNGNKIGSMEVTE